MFSPHQWGFQGMTDDAIDASSFTVIRLTFHLSDHIFR